MTGGGPESPTRRERVRAATLDEIKQTALEIMRKQGSPDVRFTDIARAMGITAPALYRYFADRDELLTAILADSFADLAEELVDAREAIPADDPVGRLMAICGAYRRWAQGNPERFSVMFGTPVPGYAAPVGGPTVEAARRSTTALIELLADAERHGLGGFSLTGEEAGPAFTAMASDTLAGIGADLSARSYQMLLLTWTSLHGFVSLEVNGHFCWMDDAVRDELFLAQVRATAMSAALTVLKDDSGQST